MGTRSLTVFKNGDEEIAVLYRQFDGYPSGHGEELAGFLKNKLVVNGISGDPRECFNGPNAVAAQTVAHFVDANSTGGFYLYAAGTRNVWEEFIYTVECSLGNSQIKLKVQDSHGKVIFHDDPAAFDSEKLEEAA